MLQSLALLVPLIFVLPRCANLACPPGQELGDNACACSSTLEPPINGMCTQDVCDPAGCPCTLEGIEAAIARGGTQLIKCDENAPPVDTTDTIVIDNDVTLNGQGNLTVQGDGGHLMFDVQPFEVELIGFTITRGRQAIRVSPDATLTLTNSTVKLNTSSLSAGGGIFNDGVLTLVGTTLEDNIADVGGGGGIFNSSTGTLMLTNSRVLRNRALRGPGGGIQNDEGAVVVDGTEISQNIASQGDGGGISNVDGTVDVTDSDIQTNTANVRGGGISTSCTGISTCGESATVTITDTTVSGNKLFSDGGVGGGLWGGFGKVQAERTTWSGNTTELDGGAILIEGAETVFTLIASTVSGNTAGRVGGAIRVYDNASVKIINSTIFDNRAGDGGALHVERGASAELSSSTISNNGIGGAGVTNIDGTLTFVQTIIDDTCVAIATTMSEDYNIESPGDTCQLDGANDMVNVTPEALNLAEELADNTGPTHTLILTRPSVAVDYLIRICDQTEDQRGVSRPQGTECDIGAVEIE
jgi:hypothetical protein